MEGVSNRERVAINMPDVWIPLQLRRLTAGKECVQVPGDTIRQVIDNLEKAFPGLKAELYDEEEDMVMPGLAVVVNGETSQLGLLERVQEGSEIHFLPALGGGV
jgi:molybdopterin synthase sulfur carrier subunit